MKLSLLQWNVYCREKAENIISLIEDNKADILCLQEVTRVSKENPNIDIAKAIAKLGYNYCFGRTIKREGDNPKEEGCAIFSKFPIKDYRQIYVQDADTESTPPKYNRIYLEADIETPEGILKIGTTHLSYSHNNFEMTEARTEEANRLLEAIGEKDSRYVLTGDFNANPDSFLVKELLGKFKNVSPDYAEKTWTTKPFSYHGFETNDLGWRLDYVFATQDINMESSSVINTEASDHLPILSKISI